MAMTSATVPAYLRDKSISYGAVGILSEMTAPEHDEAGISIRDLTSLAPDSEEAVLFLLAELAGAGYVQSRTAGGQLFYWATGKAYRTVPAQIGSSGR